MSVNFVRPNASVGFTEGMDGWDAHYFVEYSCPTCNKNISEGVVACTKCGTFFDWSKHAKIVVSRSVEWVP